MILVVDLCQRDLSRSEFVQPIAAIVGDGAKVVGSTDHLAEERIRQMIEGTEKLSRQDIARMQMDVLSLRAVEAVPRLVRLLTGSPDSCVRSAVSCLESWDCRMEPDSVPASLFEVFFRKWCEAISAERFPADSVATMAGVVGGLAIELLSEDKCGWFASQNRGEAVLGAMIETLRELESRLGSDTSGWAWGRIHTINLDHRLSGRGDLSQLLSRGGLAVGGDGTTVCNTGPDPDYLVATGANYRLNADLSESPPGLWAVDAAGQSGHPGSPHYCDQLPEWLSGRHHYLPMDRERVEAGARSRLRLRAAD